jgi:hypothetical protein
MSDHEFGGKIYIFLIFPMYTRWFVYVEAARFAYIRRASNGMLHLCEPQ